MRALLLVLLVLVAAAPPVLAQQPGHERCVGEVTVTGFSPVEAVAPGLHLVRATFHGEGPGHLPQECDIGWVVGCALFVDGAAVPARCRHPNGDDRCHEVHERPYVCDVELSGVVRATNGSHTLRATLTMVWGCCGWRSGPQASASAMWSVPVAENGTAPLPPEEAFRHPTVVTPAFAPPREHGEITIPGPGVALAAPLVALVALLAARRR